VQELTSLLPRCLTLLILCVSTHACWIDDNAHVERPEDWYPERVTAPALSRQASALVPSQAKTNAPSPIYASRYVAWQILKTQAKVAPLAWSQPSPKGEPSVSLLVTGRIQAQARTPNLGRAPAKAPSTSLFSKQMAFLRNTTETFANPTLRLDLGTTLTNRVGPLITDESELSKASIMAQGLGLAHVDGMLAQPTALRIGTERLTELVERHTLPLISANLSLDGVAPARVIQRGDTRIALVGVSRRQPPRQTLEVEIGDPRTALYEAAREVVAGDPTWLVVLSGVNRSHTTQLLKTWPDDVRRPDLVLVGDTTRLSASPSIMSFVPVVEVATGTRHVMQIDLFGTPADDSLDDTLTHVATLRQSLARLHARIGGALRRKLNPQTGSTPVFKAFDEVNAQLDILKSRPHRLPPLSIRLKKHPVHSMRVHLPELDASIQRLPPPTPQGAIKPRPRPAPPKKKP